MAETQTQGAPTATPESEPAVLVAVDNPNHVGQLVRTAAALAAVEDARVEIVTVAVKPADSPFSVYTDEAIVERFSGNRKQLLETATSVTPDGIDVSSRIVVGRSVSEGVLEAVGEVNPNALVVGWFERRGRTDSVLGTTVDRLVERAPCDLYVERIGYEADGVESILLPVAGGPHVRPAAAAAKAIAIQSGATVTTVSVVGPDVDADTARESAREAAATIEAINGADVDVETAVRTTDPNGSIVETIAAMADDHDVVVFGATRKGTLRRRVVGSIPQAVVRKTDRTVILARSGEGVAGSIIDRLGRLWSPR